MEELVHISHLKYDLSLRTCELILEIDKQPFDIRKKFAVVYSFRQKRLGLKIDSELKERKMFFMITSMELDRLLRKVVNIEEPVSEIETYIADFELNYEDYLVSICFLHLGYGKVNNENKLLLGAYSKDNNHRTDHYLGLSLKNNLLVKVKEVNAKTRAGNVFVSLLGKRIYKNIEISVFTIPVETILNMISMRDEYYKEEYLVINNEQFKIPTFPIQLNDLEESSYLENTICEIVNENVVLCVRVTKPKINFDEEGHDGTNNEVGIMNAKKSSMIDILYKPEEIPVVESISNGLGEHDNWDELDNDVKFATNPDRIMNDWLDRADYEEQIAEEHFDKEERENGLESYSSFNNTIDEELFAEYFEKHTPLIISNKDLVFHYAKVHKNKLYKSVFTSEIRNFLPYRDTSIKVTYAALGVSYRTNNTFLRILILKKEQLSEYSWLISKPNEFIIFNCIDFLILYHKEMVNVFSSDLKYAIIKPSSHNPNEELAW